MPKFHPTKKASALTPCQREVVKSLCKVGEAAGYAALYFGVAWLHRHWFYHHHEANAEEEPRPDRQENQERSKAENGESISAVRLSDVAGLEDVKAELREKVIEPFTWPELFQRFKLKQGGGVLMFGPPGTGKTFIASAVANEVDAKFFPVNPAEIKSKWVGQTERNLQRLFDEARRHPKSVVFLDEVDAILSARGNRKIGAVTQFLALSDGLTKTSNCLLLLAATNKPWTLDEAVLRPGRLGVHIFCPPPDLKAREDILALNLDGVPVAKEVSLAEIARGTDGYSGADLAELCDCAKRSAKNRQIGSGQNEFVTKADLIEATGKVWPSVSPAQLELFESWRRNRQRPNPTDSLRRKLPPTSISARGVDFASREV